MGKPRKIKSPQQMEKLWEEYKNYCDNQSVIAHEFSQRNSQFVSAELRKKITYTVEGFCVYIGISRASFYSTYREDPMYADIVTRMSEECEIDARQKFETNTIPHQLAHLWMSKYGYSVKNETNVQGSIPVVIENDLK